MIHIAVLITHNYRPLSLAAVMDLFGSVNRLYQQKEMEPKFGISQYSWGRSGVEIMNPPAYKSNVPDSAGGAVHMNSAGRPDLILIPAFDYADMPETLRLNSHWISWLQEQFEKGSEVGTFCTGAFLAASAGLLDGKKATTHVMHANAFKNLFPQVSVQQDAVVTDDSRTYTSGGSTSSFHLMLHLLNKYCGREISLQIAKMFSIDPDRVSQSYFDQFSPSKDHKDTLVLKLQELIESRYNETMSVAELMKSLPASRRTLYRRFKIATGLTPHEYLQQKRIQAARELLEQTDHSVSEVMYECGYSDAKTFRQLFRKTVGIAPKNYRMKYNP